VKYVLNTPLLNIDGKTALKDGAGAAITFKSISTLVLVQAPDKTGEEKYATFALAVKIESEASDWVDLNVEEVSRLKRLIGELMPPVVVGRMFDLLEQKAA
jgi:hypothetical protein